ncbi:orotate phosphoribosyltransferase [Veronia pacifica]|uniref:Orotate phosphoribosyltransferase n=2 Tax=Veronia pacifica TaxID=1080227 RepID=A0A1C3EGD3_9GAMM|nr:orotate phosphoribosyltransferase [Veronia pacifica]
MNLDQLARAIYHTAHITGEFKLRSGVIADQYFDKYLFEAKPEILQSIAEHVASLLPEKYDFLAGLEMGGIPVATALSLHTKTNVLFVRKEAKQYGTCKLAEGGNVAGKELVIIEDVVTSGGAIMDAVTKLRAQGALISKVICVIDRQAGGRENLEKMGLEFTPLFTKSQLETAL